jgi:hypothetical protein
LSGSKTFLKPVLYEIKVDIKVVDRGRFSACSVKDGKEAEPLDICLLGHESPSPFIHLPAETQFPLLLD